MELTKHSRIHWYLYTPVLVPEYTCIGTCEHHTSTVKTDHCTQLQQATLKAKISRLHLLCLFNVFLFLPLPQRVLAHVLGQHVDALFHQLHVLLQALVKRLEITLLRAQMTGQY